MGFVEWNCPRCGKKNREKCNAWVYGSPIRNCKECNAEYFDRRWREIALEGVEPASKNAKLYLGATIAFFVFTCVCALRLIYDIKTLGGYPERLLGCVLIGMVGTIGCFVVLLRIVTGYEDRQNRRYYDESVKRLQNKSYVYKLIAYGYDVPEEFR